MTYPLSSKAARVKSSDWTVTDTWQSKLPSDLHYATYILLSRKGVWLFYTQQVLSLRR